MPRNTTYPDHHSVTTYCYAKGSISATSMPESVTVTKSVTTYSETQKSEPQYAK